MTTPPPQCPAHNAGADGTRRLHGPEAEADASGLYERLRAEHGSVAPVLLHGDLPAWLVLGYRENLDVLRTPSRFSSDPRRSSAVADGTIGPAHPLAPIVAYQPLANFSDGEEHKRLRGSITDSLGRFNRHGIRRYVTRFAHLLTDDFAGAGRADLVSQFAEHLPMLVVTQLLGMPEEHGPRLVEAVRDLIKGTETAVASNGVITGLLRELVAVKHRESGYDFASWLLEHHSELSDEEVVELLRHFLIAAHETTSNLIANMLHMVLTDPRFRGTLNGGQMTLSNSLEHVLWTEPPLSVMPARYATGDTELGGKRIRKGDMILVGIRPGNSDPAIRPDLATPMHGNGSHLAFGAGPHECPGQDIGRAIADTGIDVLLARLPDLDLAVAEDEISWSSTWMSRHLDALPVQFTPRKPRHDEDTGSTVRASAPLPPQSATLPDPVPADTAASPRTDVTSVTWWGAFKGWLKQRL